MRDPVLDNALRRLAAEAATRFTSLVATGEEVPFDVAEDSGEHTFYRYVPLTSRFVRDRPDELRSLPAFGPARSAADSAGVAAPYLEAHGEPVPEDEDERAEAMLITFVSRLWEGSAEFSLERTRLEAALHELEAEARDVSEADVLLAPLVGLQMPLPRLQLPSGVRLVRADTVEAPTEAVRSEGMQRSAWQPQFLALADQDHGAGASTSAMRMLRELISVLRLFKEGGVGLAPYAFAATGEGTWRRIATGAPATRPGGYKLSEAELEELADFARRLEARPDPEGSLAWAIARFEMGCDRPTALEGLSDHLLALRALFEGEGPVGAALPMRVAALISEPDDRPEARDKVQSAIKLERALMGETSLDTGSALGLAAWLEDGVRAILREGALGVLGRDAGTAADEALIASGLEAGEGSSEQMGSTAEWEAIPEPQEEEVSVESEPAEPDTWQLEIPDEAEIRISAGIGDSDGEEGFDGRDEHGDAGRGYEQVAGYDEQDDSEEAYVTQRDERDWLSEVSQADRDTLEWPAGARRADREERVDSPRVRHLFPVPDDTDWDIGELDYDRDKARVG